MAASGLNIEGRVRKHIRPFFEEIPIGSVRPAHARAFVAQLVGDGLAPSTVKSITLTASQVFTQAVDDGLIARCPSLESRSRGSASGRRCNSSPLGK